MQQQTKPKKDRILLAIKIVVWLIGLYLSTFWNLQNLYFIVSGIVFIFTNLGKRKPGVFNKDFKKVAGTFDPQAMLTGKSQSLANKIFDEEEQKKAINIDEYYKNPSKHGNKICYCGSGAKFKKCCLLQQRLKANEKKHKEI